MKAGLVGLALSFALVAPVGHAPDDVVLTGRVTAAAGGQPIEGANVYITELNVSVGTNAEGIYRITLAAERARGQTAQLRVRAIGFQPDHRTVKLAGDSITVDFALVADINSLSEVVVTGVTGVTESRKLAFTVAPGPEQDFRRARERFNTESYDRIEDNPFLGVRENPLSTFSIDVDRASYSNVRRFVTHGQRPPKDAVRIEELINYFTYEYPQPTGRHPFSVSTDVARAPWEPTHLLVRIGLQARRIETRHLPPSNLVFLIDVSGSMAMPNKLSLVKDAFRLLVDQLREQDRVAIVVYAGSASLLLPSTTGDRKVEITTVIDRLTPGGFTAGGAGIRLAYDMARRYHLPGGNNRVILATDGDFNIGASSDAEMERLIEEKREQGTFLSVLGFGMGNLKDSKMETLADKGNGNYAYIDDITEARKVFVEEMAGTLFTVAKDVKIQVEFNPAQVAAHRLIGYENRLLRDEDFDDDTKDAGEIGAGHSVTALYEVIPVGSERSAGVRTTDPLRYQPQVTQAGGSERPGELLYVKLRYKLPDGQTSRWLDHVVPAPRRVRDATGDLRFAAAVAAFGMILRESPHRGSISLGEVVAAAGASLGEDRGGYRADFVRLVEMVRDRRIVAEREPGERR